MSLKRRQGQDVTQMNDLQLLAHLIVLSGTEPITARALAHSMLTVYPTLEHILTLPKEQLLAYPSLGERTAVFLLLLPALMGRYGLVPQGQSLRLWVREDLERLVLPHFYGQNTERVYAFCLDERMDLITSVLCAQGGSNTVSCSVRRVLDLSLNHHAKGVILAHNHPDGIPAFSKSDLMATSALSRELAMVEIPLLDHLLLAAGEIISLRTLIGERKISSPAYPLPKEWFCT